MTPDLSHAQLGLTNPSLLLRKLCQVYNYAKSPHQYNHKGANFMEKDWDNLLILDACRYDAFNEFCEMSGSLHNVESRGSATPEFLRGNFQNRTFHDTVYVTTNPMLSRHDEINVSFYDVVNLWTGHTWSEEHETVLPETVTTEAKRIAAQYPEKRLLVHYMQPHYPFIESDTEFDKGHIGDESPTELTTWMQVMTNEVSADRDALWKAYTDNLQRVLPHVEDLVNELDGKTVITSDHGNMFGERSSPIPYREWGHPEGIWTDELVRVPWLEVEHKKRKEITKEQPSKRDENEDDGSDVVQERLKQLGYVS